MLEPAVLAELDRVDVFHGDGAARLHTLKEVSLSLAPGRLTLLMGPSGSGKTTLLTVLGLLRRPDRGRLRLLGDDVTGIDEETASRRRRQHIGYVFQAFRLFHALTGIENVMVALDIAGVRGARARARADEALAAVGLDARAAALPSGALSGGQKQRVAIARALVHGPRIVLADEPTAALDAESAGQVAGLLRRLAREGGRSVVVVTHDPRWLAHADEIWDVDEGRLRPRRLDPGGSS